MKYTAPPTPQKGEGTLIAALGLFIMAACMPSPLWGGEGAGVPPRLVVNIVIDQLRADYMEAYMQHYGEGGFRRLVGEGRVYEQVEYPFASPDRSSAVATLMTGATPYEHGIIANRWLDRGTLQPRQAVDCPAPADGSAEALAVSTLTDELKVATEGRAMVYAVAPFRDAAILSAGHAADCAFWLSDQTGAWTSTSYYGTAPAWLARYDAQDPTSRRIDHTEWTPLIAENEGRRSKKDFKYTFKGIDRFRQFKQSAMVNDEVTRLAAACVREAGLGSDDVPDLLALTYYAGGGDARTPEMRDTYVRLDRALAAVIDTVESRVGRDSVLFVLTSTGYADEPQADLTPYRIPTGEFNISRAQLLLNMYLVAIYGEGKYVEANMGGQLYLDQTLIERRGLNMAELLERCQDFLIQMQGVRDVYTSRRLALSSADRLISRIRNGYNPARSGDILIKVAPGWQLTNETIDERRLVRDSYLAFPLILMGAGVKAEKVELPVTVDQVAPTISKAIRIRAPNGCAAMTLP